MKKRWFSFIVLMVIVLVAPISAFGSTFHHEEKQNKVTLYFFHGDGCPHCEEEMEWLNEMTAKYPNLVIKEYEVWYNSENSALMETVKEKMNQKKGGVPFTVIGDKQFLGFNSSVGNSMEKEIRACSKHTYRDVVKEVLESREEVYIGEELESKEETEEKEQIEDKKNFDTNMKNRVWHPLFTVVGVSLLCFLMVATIFVSKKRG